MAEIDFDDYLAELEDAHGIELDEEDVDAIAQALDEHGATTDVVDAVFQQIASTAEEYEEQPEQYEEEEDPGEEAFVRDAAQEYDRLEAKLGRRLTEREAQAVGFGIVDQARRYDEISAEQAPRDLSRAGRPQVRHQQRRPQHQPPGLERLGGRAPRRSTQGERTRRVRPRLHGQPQGRR